MTYAIILAAGFGKRMKNTTPKQFINVLGKPLIYYTINAFETNHEIDEIVIVTSKKYFTTIYQIIDEFSFKKVQLLVEGGKSRQMSSHNALEALKDFASQDDIVLIHDAARPLVAPDNIHNLIAMAKKHSCATLGIKVVDTIVKIKNHRFKENIIRDDLIQIQTPQAFKFKIILRAHEIAKKRDLVSFTDDAQLMQLINKRCYIVDGNKTNFKVTTPGDLILLEALLRSDQK